MASHHPRSRRTVEPILVAIVVALGTLAARGAPPALGYAIEQSTDRVVQETEVRWSAPNPAHGFRTHFTDRGIRVVPLSDAGPAWQLGLSVVTYGWGNRTLPVARASHHIDGNRIELDRDTITEWYVNDPRGLKQGFTLKRRPTQTGSAIETGTGATLVVSMEVDGNLQPRLTNGGRAVDFIAPRSRFAALHYTELKVWDAEGRTLPAHLDLFRSGHGGPMQLRLTVDATDAVFPIEVDPLIETAAWESTENEASTAAAWGDWDGDGDLDLAIGNSSAQPNRIYENTGGALSLAWSFSETDDTRSVAWGDWDGDGDLDLAVGNGSGQPNRVYQNTGGALGLVWSSTETDDTYSLAWGDWDGDGNLDLAVGNNGQANRVYENTGGSFGSIWSSPETDATRSVAWGDWDDDGDLDLAVGNNGQANRVYENTGGALGLTWSSVETELTYTSAWGDWDGDGDLDLAVGNGGSSGVDETVRVYENTGGSLSSTWSSSEAHTANSVAWGDWDDDGDLDLAVGTGWDATRVFENTGGSLSMAWSSFDQQLDSGVAWGDWDGDGDLDLARAGIATNRVYENTGAMGFAWETPDEATNSVAWGDWDGDGDLDLAVGNYAQVNRVYENTGSALGLTWSSTETDNSYSVAWGDWDGDGDLDLAVGNYGQSVRVYENTAGALSLTWSSTDTDGANTVAWGDWDGDGDLDLAVSGGGSVRVYENTAGALSLTWSASDTPGAYCLAWGDWDEDGDLDLVVGTVFADYLKVYENTGGALSLAWWDPAWELVDRDVAWGDWDGDGDLDLVRAGIGATRVYHNGRNNSPGGLPQTPVFPVTAGRPGTTDDAHFHSTPERLSSPISLDYTLYDEQSDPAWLIVPEYSLTAGGQWLSATVGPGGDPTTNLSASPTGTTHTFVWDAEADGACSEHASFRIGVKWQAPDHAAHPIQRAIVFASTPPFRLACSTWYLDNDGDGHGDSAVTTQAWSQPAGHVAAGGDCDDTNADTHPGAPEVNDGLDNQCPGDLGYGIVDETSGDSGFHNPADKNEYSWPAQTGATSYEVARSTVRDFSSGCTVITTSNTFWSDAEDPLSGQVFHYLNRPVAPNTGSWGQDSTGAERTGVCP